MIRHIVFFSCKNQADSETVFEGLKKLMAIPHCLHLEIARNLKFDTITETVPDFVVYGEFEDDEQLTAFKRHDTYLKAIDIVRPLRDIRIAADFVASA